MLLTCQLKFDFCTKKRFSVFKKDIATSNYVFLLRPLYLVLKLSIHICSLCFLYRGSSFHIFSKTVTCMSDNLCPGKLKCSPVALLIIEFEIYPLCSAILSCKVLWVSPMYCTGHLLQSIQYTMFLVWQLTCSVISAVWFVAVALTFFPCLI